MPEDIQNRIRISEEKRREVAKAAFWGNNERLADHIKNVLGYEMNNRIHPANGFDLKQAIEIVEAMQANDLLDFMPEPTLAIVQGETELLNGDDCSIRMIFNNLIGRNFSGTEYENYLTWARNYLSFAALAPEKLFITLK